MKAKRQFGISMNDCDLFMSTDNEMIFQDKEGNQYKLVRLGEA